MTQKIKSISVGWGQEGTYYIADPKLPHDYAFKVDHIQQEQRPHFIGESDSGCIDITVYRGYRNDKMVFEIESGSGVTLTFWEE